MPIPEDYDAVEEVTDEELAAVAVADPEEQLAGTEDAEEPEPAEEAPAEDEWRPPSRDRFDRLMRQRDFFKHSRADLEGQLQHQQQVQQQMLSELGQMREALRGQQPEPELSEDQRFAKEVSELTAGRIEPRLNSVEERLDAEAHQREQMKRAEQVRGIVDSDYAAVRDKYSDFVDGMKHLVDQRVQQWLDSPSFMGSQADAEQQVGKEMNEMVLGALQVGVSPGEHLYRIATEQYGWSPPEVENGNGKPDAAAPKPTRRETLARGAGTLSRSGGKSPQSAFPTWKDLVRASDEEYAQMIKDFSQEAIDGIGPPS